MQLLSCTSEGGSLATGSLARSYLSDTTFTKLIVEIQAVEGNLPLMASVDNLEAFLNARLNKSGGITVSVDDPIPSPGKATLSAFEAAQLAQEYRTEMTAGDTVVAHILFVDADYAANEGDSKVLGLAYQGDAAVLFKKTIDDNAGGIGQPSQEVLETTVLLHEFGHLLGLVNTGTQPVDPAHHDIPHGAHCNVEGCLMNYQVETTDILANLLGSGIPDLDPKCIEDLQANGGK
ncbi:MAG: hypothetical protein KDH09_12860 [Chrysiogenetes bacterium]|nr:hypothetical protein [Chrysiogenetes bacterium]